MYPNKIQSTLFGLSLVSLLMLSGCATNKPQADAFEGEVTLVPFGGEEDSLAQIPGDSELTRYRHVYILPVNTDRVVNAKKPPTEDTISQVVDAITEQVANQLSKEYVVLDAPDNSKPTLQIKLAVTDIAEANPAANAVMTVIAVPVSNGGLNATMEASDASTSEVVARLAYGDEGGVFSTKVFSKAGHAVQLSEVFASRVAELLSRNRAEPEQ